MFKKIYIKSACDRHVKWRGMNNKRKRARNVYTLGVGIGHCFLPKFPNSD